ncbi:MAG: hypothetical protein AAFQ24_13845 [Pseudomonadota bacterium]
MNISNKLRILIDTEAEDLTSWASGQSVLGPVFARADLKPQFIALGDTVNARSRIIVESVDHVEDLWGAKDTMRMDGAPLEYVPTLEWKRTKKIRSTGSITFPSRSRRNRLNPGFLAFDSDFDATIDWLDLFVRWCQATKGVSGLLHLQRENAGYVEYEPSDDDERNELQRRALSDFGIGTLRVSYRTDTTDRYVSGLTNLGWATFLGGDLRSKIDPNRISQAGFFIRDIGHGFIVTTTEKFSDVVDNFNHFSAQRSLLKKQFEPDLFLIDREPKNLLS